MKNSELKILDDRQPYVVTKTDKINLVECDKKSVAGSVSQRACVFCGSRVVLYPVCECSPFGSRTNWMRRLHLGYKRLAIKFISAK